MQHFSLLLRFQRNRFLPLVFHRTMRTTTVSLIPRQVTRQHALKIRMRANFPFAMDVRLGRELRKSRDVIFKSFLGEMQKTRPITDCVVATGGGPIHMLEKLFIFYFVHTWIYEPLLQTLNKETQSSSIPFHMFGHARTEIL